MNYLSKVYDESIEEFITEQINSCQQFIEIHYNDSIEQIFSWLKQQIISFTYYCKEQISVNFSLVPSNVRHCYYKQPLEPIKKIKN